MKMNGLSAFFLLVLVVGVFSDSLQNTQVCVFVLLCCCGCFFVVFVFFSCFCCCFLLTLFSL